jgi:hypothetical protein
VQCPDFTGLELQFADGNAQPFRALHDEVTHRQQA